MDYYEKIKLNVETNSQKISEKDFKFYNIGFLMDLSKATEKESCNCKDCCNNLETLVLVSQEYPQMISLSKQSRQDLEEKIEEISQHLINIHGFSKKDWYKPLFSLCGLGLGIVMGVLICFLLGLDFESGKKFFLIILTIFVSVGYCLGIRKDNKQKKKGKII